MFIKLETISETEKAYQLKNGGWIPKSILDGQGLKPPYYQIKDWWLSKCIERLHNEEDKNKDLLIKTLEGLQPLVVHMRDIPHNIRKYWSHYWSGSGDHYTRPDYEPRIWGNDCFEGDPNNML